MLDSWEDLDLSFLQVTEIIHYLHWCCLLRADIAACVPFPARVPSVIFASSSVKKV